MMMLETQGLTRTIGLDSAFEDIDMQIPEGHAVALVDQEGKTVPILFDALLGFLDTDSGSILLGGEDMGGLGPLERRARGLARSFPEDHFFEHLTIADHVLAIARNSSATENDLYAQWKQDSAYLKKGLFTLGSVGLERPIHTRVLDLTGIEKKLLGIGLAMLDPFDLMLWEDPFDGVEDPAEAIDYLFKDLRYTGKTVVFGARSPELAKRYANQLYFFHDGRIEDE